MNAPNVLSSSSSGLDAIGFRSTSAPKYPPEGIKAEQGSLTKSSTKSFKRALEEQDTKVPGDESAKRGEANTDVKNEVNQSPEPKEETATSSYGSEEQAPRPDENDDDDQVTAAPVLTSLTITTLTGMPESEVNRGEASSIADTVLQSTHALAVMGIEESIKGGKTGTGNKTNNSANTISDLNNFNNLNSLNNLNNLNILNTTTGSTARGENADASAVLANMPSAIKAGESADKNAAANIAVAKGGKGESLEISSLLVRYGGSTQNDLNNKNGQTDNAGNNSLSPEDIAVLKSGDKASASAGKETQNETQPVDIRKSLNLKSQQEQPAQGDSNLKPADVQKNQLSATFSQEDARSTLNNDHSGSKKSGDESNFSTLKVATQGGTESSAGISTSEMGKTDAKHPMQDLSAKVIEQVREPLVQAVKKGADHIQLRLKPDGLGELRIDLRVHGGKLNMQILTDNVTTKHLLEFGLPELKGQLAGNGISVGDTNVEHNEGRGENKNQEGYKQNPQDRDNNKKGNQNFREYFA